MPLTTYTAGEVLTAASLNANFAFAASGTTTAIFNETQASGTAGGGSTSGSFIKRTLNTTVSNNITGCSIAASVITLPAGTYRVLAFAPFLGGSAIKVKLRNTTDSTDAIISQNGYISITTVGVSIQLNGTFTIASSKNFELQYRVSVSKASDGLGSETSLGVDEIYSIVQIDKVA